MINLVVQWGNVHQPILKKLFKATAYSIHEYMLNTNKTDIDKN